MRRDLTVLVVGGGAREHALCWSIAKSPSVKRVLCTPGNGGITSENRRNIRDSDLPGIVGLAKEESVDLVVVGPEAPLVAGLVEILREAGVAAFGPNAKGARLEGSKIYTKTLSSGLDIPTAHWKWTDNYDDAKEMILSWGSLPVIKADGLCGGKGVVVPDTESQALDAAHDMLVKKTLGHAGSRIIIEDRLVGRECSVMALCDGENAVLLPPARDYKRALDGDRGLNTGGMGSYSPLPDVDDALVAEIKTRIIDRTLYGMAKHEGNPYRGVLYAGIMLTKDGPFLLEYNVRFGDPETQVVLPRLQSDVVEYMFATLERGGLSKLGPLQIHSGASVCTVLVSKGYPDKYQTGFPITGLDEANSWAVLFHAGTDRTPELVTSGGRVMSCVGFTASLEAAREYSRLAAEAISFENKSFRTDIAANIV